MLDRRMPSFAAAAVSSVAALVAGAADVISSASGVVTRGAAVVAPAGAVAGLTLALLVACATVPPPSGPPPSLEQATALERQGDQAAAAREFEALASQGSAERSELLLRAAGAYLAARETDGAARVLAALQPPLTAAQSFERQMLVAQLDLARGEGEQAWRHIALAREPGTAPQALAYLELKRRAALAASRPADAVRAEIEAERFLETPAERRTARVTLLEGLRDASEHGMKIDPRTARDPTVRGWLDLAGIVAQAARAPASAASAIDAWRVRYPGHPADAVLGSALLGFSVAPPQAQPHVALLLPLSGRAASAAATVRDGFMTAYYVSPPGERPRIRIYDTGTASVAEAVDQATRDGADFIVGPLTREAVLAAATLRTPRPPVLALNFLPAEQAAPPGFYQFALSPEEEAREVARRILADGHRHGIALAPLGDWGTRVLTAFKTELTAGGGVLLDTARFDPTLTDFAPVITGVLRIDDSNDRLRRLESILGTRLAFQPRRRDDIDFIFEAAAAAPTARLLRTQIKFYFAGDVPAYATSDSFEPDPNANQDLDGLSFPDMPWMLGGGLAESVQAAATSAWPVEGPPLDRLFAFGFDAYRLLNVLRTPPPGGAISIEGLTGVLTLDANRRIHRQLDWAQLHDGQPRLLSPPAPAPGPASTQEPAPAQSRAPAQGPASAQAPGPQQAPAPAATPTPRSAPTSPPTQAPTSTSTSAPTSAPH